MRKLLTSLLTISTIFLSSCSSINYVRFLFIDKETREAIRNLQERVENNNIYGTDPDKIYTLPAEDPTRTKEEKEELNKY